MRDSDVGQSAFAQRLESWCARLPLLIIAYFAFQAAIRFGMSGNLEIDEAEVASRSGFHLGYGNSHPPLFEWIVFMIRDASGSWPFAFAVTKAVLLAATFLLMFRTGRVLTGTNTGGAVFSLSMLLIPEIVWQSQITLAHSVLALCASVAFVTSLVLVGERSTLPRLALLGCSLAAALLAKYNTWLLVGGLLAAVMMIPAARTRYLTAKVAAAVLAGLALAAPHYVWAVQNLAGSTERLARMMKTDPMLSRLDLPVVGVDGVIALMASLVSSGGLLIVLWLIGRFVSRAEERDPDPTDYRALWQALSGRALAVTIAAIAAALFLTDAHRFPDRYLTPILVLLPIWLCLRLPLDHRTYAARRTIGLSLAIAAVVAVAWPMVILFGRHAYAYPYGALAAQIADDLPAGTAIAMPRLDDAVNMRLRLDGTELYDPANSAESVAVLWSGSAETEPTVLKKLADGYRSLAPVRTITAPFDNLSGRTAILHLAILQRSAAASNPDE
jgi:4-amino-4-deoxy-L-arabinose transferase-like glycosyltransferase